MGNQPASQPITSYQGTVNDVAAYSGKHIVIIVQQLQFKQITTLSKSAGSDGYK